jgi:hypothetical protein
MLPLVFTGETRDRAKMTTIVVTTNRGQLKYSVNALNFNPWTRDEFARVTTSEVEALGQIWESVYNMALDKDLDQGMRFV